MRSRQQHVAVEPNCALHLPGKAPHPCARQIQRTKDALGQPQRCNDRVVPTPGICVHQRGGRCVRIFVQHIACEQIIEIFRYHQQTAGSGQLFRVLTLQSRQLIRGIEHLLLDTCAGVQLRERQATFRLFHRAFRAFVPIRHGVAHRPAVGSHQHKIHGPGVYTHGFGNLIYSLARAQSLQNALPQLFRIPAVMPVFPHLNVIEAIDLLQHHAAFLHMAQNMAPGGCADVDGKMIFHMIPPARSARFGCSGTALPCSFFHYTAQAKTK